MNTTLASFTDVLGDEICNSQPMSLPSSYESRSTFLTEDNPNVADTRIIQRPSKGTGQRGQFRSTEEIDSKYRDVFSYPYFNLVQSSVIEDAIYSDKSIVVCAPTGSGKTVVFEMAIVQLLMELEDKQYTEDFKIIYMAPVKALCTERLTEWYPKFTKLGLLCIEVTGDTDVDFTQLKPYKIIITTPEKWDMLTRRWRDHRGLVEVIKLFLIDEVHILNDELRGPVLEAVVSRMKTIESSAQSVHRIEQLQKQLQGEILSNKTAPRIRFVAVSATVSNPEDVAEWLGTSDKPAVFYKFGDECRPVKLKRIVEGYPCPEGTSIFKFDIILNYKLWPIIQKYHSGKPTLIFCNTRKSVILTAETLSRELTISFNAEQKAKLTALASSIKNKKLQALVLNGVGCHHAGLLYEERQNIEFAFRNRDLPILITTTTLAMGVNLPAHLVIVKNTQQYVNGAYQEYSISTVLQMVGRAGRPQFDTEATAVIMTRLVDKARYQALVGGCEPLQSYLHKRLAENLNSEAALGTVGDVAQCVQWLRSTFLYVRAAHDPKKYLGLPQNSPQHLISKKIEELCVKAMNGLASSGLITMDDASCIESTEAGRLMSIFYLDLETMKHIMKIEGTESLERLLILICESHELADMHLRVDERRCLNTLNRNNAAATIRFPMKGKISTRQMKLNCIIQAVLGCLSIPDPSLNQEAMKIMRIAERVCKCLVTYVTRPELMSRQPQFYSAVLNSITLAKCVSAHLWENSPFVSKQLKGIGPTFSALLASSGKVNFMLLEESHPRDLERIMNKNAPAGNILRKQISLLPKYQLTMIPVDDKTVTVQLVLLNQSHLSMNMENLTAGDGHKSYIIVGDSKNHLLLLASFKDKDLISVFDGTITYEIKRKHSFEHKVFAHCISSSYVGIDVQSEYFFNDLHQFLGSPCNKTHKNFKPMKIISERQTSITDTFKERKRKNPDVTDNSHSKEKKKRDTAIIENFKYLKHSFDSASKNLNLNFHETSKPSKQFLNKEIDSCAMPSYAENNVTRVINTNPMKEDNNILLSEHIDTDDFIDEEKINSIINEIENEMSKSKASSINTKINRVQQNHSVYNPFSSKLKTDVHKRVSIQNVNTKSSSCKTLSETKKGKPKTPKSNYNFIDLLERNLSLSDDDDKTDLPQKENGFSETIKCKVQNYVSKTQGNANVSDMNVEKLLKNQKSVRLNGDTKLDGNNLINPDYEISARPNLYPRYEIKEILYDKDFVAQSRNIHRTDEKHDANLVCKTDSKVCNIKNKNEIEEQCNINEQGIQEIKPLSFTDMTLLDEDSTSRLCVTEKIDFDARSTFNELSTNAETAKNNIYKIYKNNSANMSVKDITSRTADNECREYDLNCSDEVTSNYHKMNDTISNELWKNRYASIKVLNRCTEINENNSHNMCLLVEETHNPNLLNNREFIRLNESSITCSDPIPSNRKKVSLNDILMVEETDHNIDSNQARHNKISNPAINISIFPSDLMNDSQNLPNNYFEDLNTCEQKTDYVKKYSFSASKYDICTKQTPEYSVKVIKRVKMDLDITEIVSRKNKGFQNYKSNEETPKNKKCYVPSKHHYKTFQNDTPNVDEFVIAVNNEVLNTSKVDLQLVSLPRSENSKAKNFDMPQIKIIDQEGKEENNSPIIYEKDIFRTCVPILNNNQSNDNTQAIQNDDLKEQQKPNVDYENPREDLRQTELDISPVDKDNKIRNVLQKYSCIIRKNAVGPVIPTYSRINGICNKSSTIKTKKPFKISDIHKLHASLPASIVDIKQEAEQKNLPPSKMNDVVEQEKKYPTLNSSQCAQGTKMMPMEQTVTKYELITDLDIEPIHIPTNADLEPSTDFKIDQSMFDPKNLLQCVINDNSDEIVPPPAEFCDGISYSPGYDDAKATITDNDSQCYYEPQLDICTEINMEYNESIFDDSCATDLTPSREIETWNLPREDSWKPHNSMNHSPFKSFTIMRKNIHNDSILPQNSVFSKKDKLGKFRLSQKNKYRFSK